MVRLRDAGDDDVGDDDAEYQANDLPRNAREQGKRDDADSQDDGRSQVGLAV